MHLLITKFLLGELNLKGNNLILIMLLLFLSSCSNRTALQFKKCSEKIRYHIPKKNQYEKYKFDFNLVTNVWSFYDEFVDVEDILSKENLSCKKVKFISVSISKGFLDNLSFIVPFFSRRTVRIRGNFY